MAGERELIVDASTDISGRAVNCREVCMMQICYDVMLLKWLGVFM